MGYDGVGNLKSMLASVPAQSSYGGLTSYTNNGQDELTQETSARNGGCSNAFGYDAAENALDIADINVRLSLGGDNVIVWW